MTGWHLYNGKRHVWVENTYFKSKFNKNIYINAKLIVSKILNIVFIVATILLSQINIALQSILVRLNLSQSLFKHKDYEYTNVIFRVDYHLF